MKLWTTTTDGHRNTGLLYAHIGVFDSGELKTVSTNYRWSSTANSYVYETLCPKHNAFP